MWSTIHGIVHPEEGCNPGNWDALQTAVKNLKAAGVVVVVSAGNSGPGCSNTIDAPIAHFESSFSVGATMFNDTIANFSSRGPVVIDSSFRIKPDELHPAEGLGPWSEVVLFFQWHQHGGSSCGRAWLHWFYQQIQNCRWSSHGWRYHQANRRHQIFRPGLWGIPDKPTQIYGYADGQCH